MLLHVKTGKTTKEVIKRNVKHKVCNKYVCLFSPSLLVYTCNWKSKGKESKYGCKSEGKGKKKVILFVKHFTNNSYYLFNVQSTTH